MGCAAGRWSSVQGATSSEVCSPCPAGTWNHVEGSTSDSQCMKCPIGTWNDQTGSSTQTSCTKCASGRWNNESGSVAESSCVACRVGTYQPFPGQASPDVCIACAPGNYSITEGVSACTFCPPGTWSGDFDVTSCNVCPQGTWSSYPGSLRLDQCARCWDSSDCLPDASGRVTIEFGHLDFLTLNQSEQSRLATLLAHDIASTCDVEKTAVVDFEGKKSTVTITAGGIAAAFVLGIVGQSATDLAAKLYSTSFRSVIVSTTVEIVHSSSKYPTITSITFEPRPFTLPTSATTTTIATTTSAHGHNHYLTSSSQTGTAGTTTIGNDELSGALTLAGKWGWHLLALGFML